MLPTETPTFDEPQYQYLSDSSEAEYRERVAQVRILRRMVAGRRRKAADRGVNVETDGADENDYDDVRRE